ncbi:hypothetical protein YC2023_018583 [Brassica napus]
MKTPRSSLSVGGYYEGTDDIYWPIPIWKYPKSRISWFIKYRSRIIHSTTCLLPPITPRKKHYIYSCKISQPQPPRGKKQLLLTRSMVHPAGNTSPREDSTRLTSFLLVPAGPGPKPQVRPLQSSVPDGPGPKPQVRPLQSSVRTGPGPKATSQTSTVSTGSNIASPRRHQCFQTGGVRRRAPGNTAGIPGNH